MHRLYFIIWLHYKVCYLFFLALSIIMKAWYSGFQTLNFVVWRLSETGGTMIAKTWLLPPFASMYTDGFLKSNLQVFTHYNVEKWVNILCIISKLFYILFHKRCPKPFLIFSTQKYLSKEAEVSVQQKHHCGLKFVWNFEQCH